MADIRNAAKEVDPEVYAGLRARGYAPFGARLGEDGQTYWDFAKNGHYHSRIRVLADLAVGASDDRTEPAIAGPELGATTNGSDIADLALFVTFSAQARQAASRV